MKVLSIIVFGCTSQRPNTLSQHLDLSEFGVLKKGTIKEFLFFASREVLSRTKPGNTLYQITLAQVPCRS